MLTVIICRRDVSCYVRLFLILMKKYFYLIGPIFMIRSLLEMRYLQLRLLPTVVFLVKKSSTEPLLAVVIFMTVRLLTVN